RAWRSLRCNDSIKRHIAPLQPRQRPLYTHDAQPISLGNRGVSRMQTSSAALGIVFLSIHWAAHAQVATGNIRGTVMDATEAIIANAKVTLVNVNTGLQRIVTTNDSGDFNAPSMPLGDYQVAAEAPGFQRKVLTGVNLQVDQTATLRIALQPGAVTESVEI